MGQAAAASIFIYPRSTERFPEAICSSASAAFRIVSHTLARLFLTRLPAPTHEFSLSVCERQNTSRMPAASAGQTAGAQGRPRLLASASFTGPPRGAQH